MSDAFAVDFASGLRPFARSRRKPVKSPVPALGRVPLFLREHLAWRFASSARIPRRLIQAIQSAAGALEALSEAALAAEISQARPHPDALLKPEGARDIAMALEVVRRETGLRLRDNQIECALRLLAGDCVELRTGEGKTLAAALAALAAARAGVSVHVVTVNDYLAERDHALIAPMAARMGLGTAVIAQQQPDAEKRAAYDNDIVYGTNKTFVFDALRDRREQRQGRPLSQARQMGQSFAIVDEVDSALIDDATVPMILSEPTTPPPKADLDLFRDLLRFADAAKPGAQRSQDHRGAWRLTEAGVTQLAAEATHWVHPAARDSGLLELAETALAAKHAFLNGVHYVIQDEAIVMIDQATGRLMGDRKWAYGMQQMIELKEGVEPTSETRTVGQITQQTYFRQYRHLSGLTGTAKECRGEFWAIYRLPVRPVAPHRPSQLKPGRLWVHSRAAQKWARVAAHAVELARTRAVLIGVNDVAESQALQAMFADLEREVSVLDALTEAQEADLVAEAGQVGRITIATHLAGRGTDIGLSPDVLRAGGLHVILASAMASGRLERQLYGRAGRQGDPGSYERHISLEDRGLREGVPRWVRAACLTLIRLRLAPSWALARLQAARDGRARGMRRRTLLREQDLARRLGYR